MKEQKPEKPEQEQKQLRQGQPDETDVETAEQKAASTTGRNGTQGAVGGQAVRSLSSAQKLARPESTMHSETSTRKARGRLTRDAMKIIGKTLEAYYDDVRKEGTPDRFKKLLQQFDERQERRNGDYEERKDKESS
jgi:hypothetical protein